LSTKPKITVASGEPTKNLSKVKLKL
jgi:hypothetical protein